MHSCFSPYRVHLISQVSEEEVQFLTEGADPYHDTVIRNLFHPKIKLLFFFDALSFWFVFLVEGLTLDCLDDGLVDGILGKLLVTSQFSWED